jgi:hypothetical protein
MEFLKPNVQEHHAATATDIPVKLIVKLRMHLMLIYHKYAVGTRIKRIPQEDIELFLLFTGI